MLVTSRSRAFGARRNFNGALGDLHDDLVTLKQNVDRCLKAFPLTSSNSAADMAATCAMFVGGEGGPDQGIRPYEKLTLLEPADNALMFDIARAIITGWRNTDAGPAERSSESGVRRIAASKLGEPAVFDAVSPTLAAQTLSSAGRIEANDVVKLKIAQGLHTILLTRDIPKTVRTEAKTTLGILADPSIQSDVYVLNAATVALREIARQETPTPPQPPSPSTVPPSTKPPTSARSRYAIPIVATLATVAISGGALWFAFGRRPAHALSGGGRLRRRVEAQIRRRSAARR